MIRCVDANIFTTASFQHGLSPYIHTSHCGILLMSHLNIFDHCRLTPPHVAFGSHLHSVCGFSLCGLCFLQVLQCPHAFQRHAVKQTLYSLSVAGNVIICDMIDWLPVQDNQTKENNAVCN